MSWPTFCNSILLQHGPPPLWRRSWSGLPSTTRLAYTDGFSSVPRSKLGSASAGLRSRSGRRVSSRVQLPVAVSRPRLWPESMFRCVAVPRRAHFPKECRHWYFAHYQVYSVGYIRLYLVMDYWHNSRGKKNSLGTEVCRNPFVEKPSLCPYYCCILVILDCNGLLAQYQGQKK